MLLNDKQIRELCTPPTAFVNHIVPYQHEDGTMSSVVVTKPTHDSIEVIREKMRLEHIGAVVQPGDRYTLMELFDPNNPVHVARINKPMIESFVDSQVREVPTTLKTGINGTITFDAKVISFGVSSMGYDVRLAEDFKIFSNVNALEVDPKNFNEGCLIDGKLNTASDGSKYVVIPPNSYLLGHTIEKFNVPRDIMIVALGKSTYARAGALVNVTPIEPGFIGTVVIEVSNSTPLPLRVYANEGIAQFIFLQGENCEVSYADRNGKYQLQTGVQLPIT